MAPGIIKVYGLKAELKKLRTKKMAWLGPRPGPARTRARLGPGPGLGPGPAWARARLGPRPGLGPGPSRTPAAIISNEGYWQSFQMRSNCNHFKSGLVAINSNASSDFFAWLRIFCYNAQFYVLKHGMFPNASDIGKLAKGSP